MKSFLTIISFLAITISALAGNPVNSLTPEMRLDAAIESQIAFPSFLMDEPGVYTADINFQINANGTITVRDIATDNGPLKANLTRQIKSIQVNTAGLDLHQTYKITFRFRIRSENETNGSN